MDLYEMDENLPWTVKTREIHAAFAPISIFTMSEVGINTDAQSP